MEFSDEVVPAPGFGDNAFGRAMSSFPVSITDSASMRSFPFDLDNVAIRECPEDRTRDPVSVEIPQVSIPSFDPIHGHFTIHSEDRGTHR